MKTRYVLRTEFPASEERIGTFYNLRICSNYSALLKCLPYIKLNKFKLQTRLF